MEQLIGRFARSEAGHDKGCQYVVIRVQENTVYLCDGKYHTMDKLKKKSLKHVMVSKSGVEPQLQNRILNNERIFDYEIKYAIKIRGKEEGYVKK